jgi:hypothetical protein
MASKQEDMLKAFLDEICFNINMKGELVKKNYLASDPVMNVVDAWMRKQQLIVVLSQSVLQHAQSMFDGFEACTEEIPGKRFILNKIPFGTVLPMIMFGVFLVAAMARRSRQDVVRAGFRDYMNTYQANGKYEPSTNRIISAVRVFVSEIQIDETGFKAFDHIFCCKGRFQVNQDVIVVGIYKPEDATRCMACSDCMACSAT